MESILINNEKDVYFLRKCYKESGRVVVFDTETTGLYRSLGHVPFAIQLLIPNKNGIYNTFYINLYDYDNSVKKTPKKILQQALEIVFISKEERLLIAHNIKFDLHMLSAIGIKAHGTFYDTQVIARLLKNNLPSYSLKNLSKKYLPSEFQKDDEINIWMNDKDNIKTVKMPIDNGKKNLKYNPLFINIDFKVMFKYGIQDVITTYWLFKKQQSMLKSYEDSEPEYYECLSLNIELECDVTKALFSMENRGLLVDKEYLDAAINHEENTIKEYEYKFFELTGQHFLDSDKILFDEYKRLYSVELPMGEPTPKLKLVKPKTDAETLRNIDVPLSDIVLAIRRSTKRLNTYLLNIKKTLGSGDILYPNFNQTGAASLRMSSSDPLNLQNLPAEDGAEEYPIRGCFIPRPGYKFCFIDFAAQEVRLILDLAGEVGAIKKILDGEDPHQANADIAGCSRKQAKTVIFSILYGSGTSTLAEQLKVSVEEAAKIKKKILDGLPKLRDWAMRKINFAEDHGISHNCFGVRYHWDFNEKYYKAVNYDIQGGCAYITKKACVAIEKLKNSNKKYAAIHPVVTVHDEFGIEVPETFSLIDCKEIVKVMCDVYMPRNGLKMSADPEILEYRWEKS
jgi:DNA polymerase-1